MELRHIRYFVAVAEEQHFTNAAKRLHVAQPPLSQQIHQLEEEIQVKLFERKGRGVVLTFAGREFLESSRKILRQVDQAVQKTQDAQNGVKIRLSVGYVDTTLYAGTPISIFNKFRTLHPEIALDLISLNSVEQWDALENGKIEIGFVYHLSPRSDFNDYVIGHDTVVLALPEKHPLTKAKRLRLRDLTKESFVWTPRWRSPPYYDLVAGACKKGGFQMRVIQEAQHNATLLSLVAAGTGLTFAPYDFRFSKPAGVVLKRVEDLNIPLKISAVWRKQHTSLALNSFLTIVQSYRR
jgi:DNA-binding transcriptional LysR family regulator